MTVDEEVLTEGERYIQYGILVPQCKRICEPREVSAKYFGSIYQSCNLFAITLKLCEKYSAEQAVEIFRSLKEKGFVFEFEKDGCDTPSFVPLGWHQIKEVKVTYRDPPADYKKA
jgi:hypothetical protein